MDRSKSKYCFRHFFVLSLLLILGNVAFAQDDAAENKQEDKESETPMLTIGAKAPELDIEHWISDDNGLFEHVMKFEKGKVYVIDFASVGFTPSILLMPSMAEMQTKFRDDVQIISICTEKPEQVEDFLDREVINDKDG